MDSPYLTVKEVAQLLNKSEKWCYLKKDQLPGYFKLAGSIFFDKDVLLATLKSQATKPVKRFIR
jgi:predicted DNA-binding transcriptional regulator AlpA